MLSSLRLITGRTKHPLFLSQRTSQAHRMRAASTITCFKDNDVEYTSPPSRTLLVRQLNGLRIDWSPWAAEILALDGYGKMKAGGGGNRGGNDDDDGKGPRPGPGRDNSDEKNSPAVALLLTFSALHLGYCLAAWMRKDSGNLGLEFYGLGLGLVSLLAASAVFVSIGAASDGYIFRLWSFVAAMIGTGETCFVHKHGRLSGFMTLFGISTVTMLSCL